MSALPKFNDDAYAVQQENVGGVAAYVRALVERPDTIKFKIGAGRIYYGFDHNLPYVSGLEQERKQLCDILTDYLHSYAANEAAQAVDVKVTISGRRNELLPPLIVEQGEYFLAVDGNGALRRVFIPPYHALTNPAAAAIASGIAVSCRIINPGYHRLHEDRGTRPRHATGNLPNRAERNRDLLIDYDDRWPPPSFLTGHGEEPHGPPESGRHLPPEVMVPVEPYVTNHPAHSHAENGEGFEEPQPQARPRLAAPAAVAAAPTAVATAKPASPPPVKKAPSQAAKPAAPGPHQQSRAIAHKAAQPQRKAAPASAPAIKKAVAAVIAARKTADIQKPAPKPVARIPAAIQKPPKPQAKPGVAAAAHTPAPAVQRRAEAQPAPQPAHRAEARPAASAHETPHPETAPQQAARSATGPQPQIHTETARVENRVEPHPQPERQEAAIPEPGHQSQAHAETAHTEIPRPEAAHQEMHVDTARAEHAPAPQPAAHSASTAEARPAPAPHAAQPHMTPEPAYERRTVQLAEKEEFEPHIVTAQHPMPESHHIYDRLQHVANAAPIARPQAKLSAVPSLAPRPQKLGINVPHAQSTPRPRLTRDAFMRKLMPSLAPRLDETEEG